MNERHIYFGCNWNIEIKEELLLCWSVMNDKTPWSIKVSIATVYNRIKNEHKHHQSIDKIRSINFSFITACALTIYVWIRLCFCEFVLTLIKSQINGFIISVHWLILWLSSLQFTWRTFVKKRKKRHFYCCCYQYATHETWLSRAKHLQ